MKPPDPADAMVSRAVNHLLAAGMVLRYRSNDGTSYYLGWSGRSGVLRVSDHVGSRTEDPTIYARLTIHRDSMPRNETNFEKAIALALGRYLMRAPEQQIRTPA